MVTRDDPQLDRLPTEQVIDLLLEAEARVVPVLRAAAPELAKAAAVLAGVILDGGRLLFAGAGTSGRLAAAEAAELPGTFGIAAARCLSIIAGTDPSVVDDAAEDDAAAGSAAARAARLTAVDAVIAVAASGRTPFTLAVATEGRAAGAAVIAVVNVAGSPLAELASATVELMVGDEVLRGSTRLTAGTAQKIALNTLTTAALARAGRVHDNLMIDVLPVNEKLRARAVGIVARIARCPEPDAAAALAACGGDVRAAVLLLARGLSPAQAVARAAAHPTLRSALES